VGLLGVHDVLPVHWGTFPILTGRPAALQAELDGRGIDARVHDWKPGETVD
jgi:L-ascorbate metabolism protein UlaG (beta-lactamase superfamily)